MSHNVSDSIFPGASAYKLSCWTGSTCRKSFKMTWMLRCEIWGKKRTTLRNNFQSVALCFDADGDGEQQNVKRAQQKYDKSTWVKAAKCIELPSVASYQANTATRTNSELVTAGFTGAKASVFHICRSWTGLEPSHRSHLLFKPLLQSSGGKCRTIRTGDSQQLRSHPAHMLDLQTCKSAGMNHGWGDSATQNVGKQRHKC